MTSKEMYKPTFGYTHRIVGNLTQIASALVLILCYMIVPKLEVTFRREAMIRSAHSSTSIEGNRLSLEQVSDLVVGREVMASRKDKQEVLNYLKVPERINSVANNKAITEKTLLKIDRMLTRGTLQREADCGVHRKRYVVVANRPTGAVTFRPLENKAVPVLVNELLSWLNSGESRNLDSVIAAGASHYLFVRIHPFIEGNGRTGRVLAALVLYLRGFDTKQLFCLDDYYDSNRAAYYEALQSVDEKSLDITSWLEYFTEGVKVSISAVRERVARPSVERIPKTRRGQIALTDRQMRIVEFIRVKGSITNRDLREMFRFSDRAPLKEMRKLVDMNVIVPKGKGRNVRYVIVR